MQRVICAGIFIAYGFVTEITVMASSSYLLGATIEEIGSNEAVFYAGALVSKVLLYLLTLCVTKKGKDRTYLAPSSYHVLLLVIVYICVGLAYLSIAEIINSGDSASLAQVMGILGITAISVLVYFVFEQLQAYAERELQIAVIEQHLHDNEQRFQARDSRYEEIRSIKHDMVNQLSSIRKLANDEKYGELTEYLDTYLKDAMPALSSSFTGKPGVDALLSEKSAAAASLTIPLSVLSSDLKDTRISAVHLNIILSNAIDNALEECIRSREIIKPYIKAEIKKDGDYLSILIINSSAPVVFAENGLPETVKIEAAQHGLGLATVKGLVGRHGGKMECAYKNGEFIFFARVKH